MRRKIALGTGLLFFATALSALSQPTATVENFTSDQNYAPLALALTEKVKSLLNLDGFQIAPAGRVGSARFVLTGFIVKDNDNIVLHLQAEDRLNEAVVVADTASIYDGSTGPKVIDSVVNGVGERLKVYWEMVKDEPAPLPPIAKELVFAEPQDGVSVYWKDHELAGVSKGGKVLSAYYPFPANASLRLVLKKTGYVSAETRIQLVPGTFEYGLPELRKVRTNEVVVYSSYGRLLGGGVSYRNYVAPDWFFWNVDLYPFVQYRPGVANSQPVAHLDVMGGVGLYLFFPAESWFRFALLGQLGLHNTWVGNTNSNYYADASLTPFDMLFEWNLFGFTIQNQILVPYALGWFPNNLLGQKWLTVGSFPWITLGASWKF